jgi:hypothetical protein
VIRMIATTAKKTSPAVEQPGSPDGSLLQKTLRELREREKP